MQTKVKTYVPNIEEDVLIRIRKLHDYFLSLVQDAGLLTVTFTELVSKGIYCEGDGIEAFISDFKFLVSVVVTLDSDELTYCGSLYIYCEIMEDKRILVFMNNIYRIRFGLEEVIRL
jgi:hypothetical protein